MENASRDGFEALSEWLKRTLDEDDLGTNAREWLGEKLKSWDEKKGWDWLEEKLGAKDEAEMKKHTDDIDTILIVDGLFSAVVTGLIVYSLDLLSGKEDRGKNAAQRLTGIFGRLNDISLRYIPPFINSTSPQDQSIDDSETPTAAARAINILWFISLTLSLASAVFGILLKQWIREYLQWTNTTNSPRQNILIRQLRYEQWKDWAIPFVLAIVPALLEVAIILFLSGALVLLWELDRDITFPFVASVVVSFSLLWIYVNISPALFMPFGCAYKSPTAEVIIVLFGLAPNASYLQFFPILDLRPSRPSGIFIYWQVLRLCRSLSFKHILTSWSYRKADPEAADTSNVLRGFREQHFVALAPFHERDERDIWRAYDLTATKIRLLLYPKTPQPPRTTQPPRMYPTESHPYSPSTAFLADLICTTEPALGDFLEGAESSNAGITFEAWASNVAPTYVDALGETDTLFRALVEAAKDLSDASNLAPNLAKCAATIQPQLSCLGHYSSISPNDARMEVGIHGGFQVITTWYMLSRVNTIDDPYMGPFFDHPVLRADDFQSIGDYIISTLQGRSEAEVLHTKHTWLPPILDQTSDSHIQSEIPVASTIMAYMLVTGFENFARFHAHRLALDSSLPPDSLLPGIVAKRMKDMLQALLWIVFYQDDGSSGFRACRKECISTLAEVFNFFSAPEHKEAHARLFPEVPLQIFSICRSSNPYKIEFKDNGHTVLLELAERKFDNLKDTGTETLSLLRSLLSVGNHLYVSDYYILSQLVCDGIAEMSNLGVGQHAQVLSKATQALKLAEHAQARVVAGLSTTAPYVRVTRNIDPPANVAGVGAPVAVACDAAAFRNISGGLAADAGSLADHTANVAAAHAMIADMAQAAALAALSDNASDLRIRTEVFANVAAAVAAIAPAAESPAALAEDAATLSQDAVAICTSARSLDAIFASPATTASLISSLENKARNLTTIAAAANTTLSASPPIWDTVLGNIKTEWIVRVVGFPEDEGRPPWIAAKEASRVRLLGFLDALGLPAQHMPVVLQNLSGALAVNDERVQLALTFLELLRVCEALPQQHNIILWTGAHWLAALSRFASSKHAFDDLRPRDRTDIEQGITWIGTRLQAPPVVASEARWHEILRCIIKLQWPRTSDQQVDMAGMSPLLGWLPKKTASILLQKVTSDTPKGT
ncbi:hypothetical protein PsYK624_062560 [Phanerochaete sordida]|uniref:DUF6535 domain-containing protein n=1 Tax=Phanerochaete sordida TaxID=48140 RepID=A0A9P3LDN9_9APHY|nr:hypothetical protein PsYK624_062560 [Phanerochaete sordida]